ncbi:protein FAR1-RELATED SEQUENCE 3-like [Silene latifolia]|uniref:protein FAR1-RELATED SEQUENCE 3-like n=1 Tax=Silene latifolia TaxID=37657 RepID=UPI003D780582
MVVTPVPMPPLSLFNVGPGIDTFSLLNLARNVREFHRASCNSVKVNWIAFPTPRYLQTSVVETIDRVGKGMDLLPIATLMQFKNFQRNVKCLLNGKDGHMFISRLETLLETKGLVFAYETDADSALARIFWTNADSIRCYALFGDVISFDPTYGTNKYNMKFAPFTGIDNHKKSITFGCVLLEHEDNDSFIWAFQQFLKAMSGKEPNYIISDQDARIINTVPEDNTLTIDNVDFVTCSRVQKRKTSLLHSEDLEPREFEENWAKIISEFSLEGNKWLTRKFAERDQRIPAYFRNVPMGNILKTTQRS